MNCSVDRAQVPSFINALAGIRAFFGKVSAGAFESARSGLKLEDPFTECDENIVWTTCKCGELGASVIPVSEEGKC